MQMGSTLRLLLLAVAGYFLYRSFFAEGGGSAAVQPIQPEAQLAPERRAPYQYCNIRTDYFHAELTSRGAAVRHFELLKPKYEKGGKAIDLSTTPHPGVALGSARAEDPTAPGMHEFRQQLFTQWRNPTVAGLPDTKWNVLFDTVDYRLESSSDSSCVFVYRDASVELRKTVRSTQRPYELEVTHDITNRASEPRAHAMAIDTTAWWRSEDVKGAMFRVSPFVTHVECLPEEGSALRLQPERFDPDDFETTDDYKVVQPWGWYEAREPPAVAAVSNAYFTNALAPMQGPAKPACQLQIEHHYAGGKQSDPASGSFYRARLAYPAAALGPGQSARYVALTYVGPKERSILAGAGGGSHRFLELIDLGFFSVIAKVLVTFLLTVHGVVQSWGIAIIVLTMTARLLLFPLSWPSIKNMIRMRELKPEIDALNAKFKDDPQAKGLAQMQLWREHKVNPLKGCLPQLASMPVWFALYTTLQTAVELYNIPFLWFPDLSESDPYFILPLIIGGTFFLQQKLMPMQGGDPAQQKMMMYFMPAMFTVFMLFLPSGLGVYMFTNSLLAIVQQQVVERQVRRSSNKPSVSERGPALGKGKV